MTMQVIETGEIVEELTRVEAERLTARIADKLDTIADNLEQVLPLIGEALTRDAWKALDYASPTAYVSERFAASFQRLPIEIRRPVVAELSAAGMSTRAIAPVMGVSSGQAAKDLIASRQVLPNEAPETAPEWRGVNAELQAAAADLPKSDKITGMDGKQYTRPAIRNDPKPEPQAPRADPVPTQFTAAIVDLNKIMARLRRISENANFTKNKNQIATLHGSDLARTISELETLADSLK